MAEDDIATLRRQLAEQRALIQAQQQQLERQAQALERMSQRLDEVAAGQAAAAPVVAATAAPAVAATPPASTGVGHARGRDAVGDLNSEAMKAGGFPGSFRIPGTTDVSLAIGGFVKVLAIADSRAEAMGADLAPETLGTVRADNDGGFSVDSTLSRVFLDGRAPGGDGELRAYVEWDLNDANDGKLGVHVRHAYGSWKSSRGTLAAGHTWSTLMDTNAIPDGLNANPSGVILARQPQVRWSQPLAPRFTVHAALEDPDGGDIADANNAPVPGNTGLPDAILGLEYANSGVGHFRLNGLLRELKANLAAGDDREVGWGLALSGHLDVQEQDRWMFSAIYGEGLGHYLVGMPARDGATVDPVRNELTARDNWGVMTAYEHRWTGTLRSIAMLGYSKSEPFDWQPDATFESSMYASANLMWQVFPYLSVGAEYTYGKRENKAGPDFDNNRLAVGFQFY